MLAGGFGGRAAEIFASARTSDGSEAPYIAALRAKAERAQPKPTDKNPLYAHFGARRCAPCFCFRARLSASRDWQEIAIALEDPPRVSRSGLRNLCKTAPVCHSLGKKQPVCVWTHLVL